MGRPTLALSDTDAQGIAFDLCQLAAAGATDAEITSRLLGPVVDMHGVDGAMTVIATTVRALAGLLHLAPDAEDEPDVDQP